MVLGFLHLSMWTRDSYVVPNRNTPMMSALAMSGSALRCLEASNVLTKRLSLLLLAAPKVPWVTKTLVRALEVPHEDFSEVRPVMDPVGWEVLKPGGGQVG